MVGGAENPGCNWVKTETLGDDLESPVEMLRVHGYMIITPGWLVRRVTKFLDGVLHLFVRLAALRPSMQKDRAIQELVIDHQHSRWACSF